MKTGKDLPALIRGFYALQTEGHNTGHYEGTDFVALLRRLYLRAFSDYQWDIQEILAQAQAQLRANKEAVEYRRPVRFKFASLSGGSPLVIAIGVVPGGTTLGLWAEDPVINEQIQMVLRETEKKEDTNP